MREFFKGWRRKIGCALLVMPCVIMGMWVKGQLAYESMQWKITSSTRIQLELHRWYFHCNCAWARKSIEDGEDDRTFKWVQGSESAPDSIESAILPWCGVVFWSRWSGLFVDIPYMPTVLILAAGSAYLILWNPRKRTEPEHG